MAMQKGTDIKPAQGKLGMLLPGLGAVAECRVPSRRSATPVGGPMRHAAIRAALVPLALLGP